jgi:hypothetical protein
MMCVLLDCMHEEAAISELLIIPSIGLAIIKTATNPAELKAMMLQMDSEATYELVIRLDELLEFLPWLAVTLIFGMTSGYCLHEYIIKPWALGTKCSCIYRSGFL